MADEGHIDLPLSWVGYDETPMVFVNQFLVQFQNDQSFVLAAGQASPPPIIGTADEVREKAKQIEFVPVRTVARLAFTEPQMRKLIAVLQANLENFEKVREKLDPRNES